MIAVPFGLAAIRHARMQRREMSYACQRDTDVRRVPVIPLSSPKTVRQPFLRVTGRLPLRELQLAVRSPSPPIGDKAAASLRRFAFWQVDGRARRLPALARVHSMKWIAVLAVFAVIASAPAHADDDVRVQLSTGYDFTSGRFGFPTDTQISTVALTGRLSYERWRLRLYLPYLYIHGPAGAIAIDKGAGGKPLSVAHGLGDVTTALTYAFEDKALQPFYFVLGGALRLPTGSYSKGLGVGAVDYGLVSEFGLSYPRGGAYIAPAYRFRGNHTRVNHRLDGPLLTSGFWINADPDWQFGGYFGYSERTTRTLSDQEELGAYARYEIREGLTAQLYGGHGLSRASGDVNAGLRLQWSL
jgi:hypothetical protein